MHQQSTSSDYIDKLLQLVNQHLAGEKHLPADLLQRFPQLTENQPKTVLEKADLKDPELQQALSAILNYTPSQWLLEQEKQHIIERRLLHDPGFKEKTKRDGSPLEIYDWAQEHRVTGLCFSGGGIRSATFNLGVLQALAVENRLSDFDYLSSVSGGGYIHSWLAAWLLRKTREGEKEKAAKPRLDAWRKVMERLHPLSIGHVATQPVWPRQIQWLRSYSNYLTPQKGFMSGDTWAAAAVWLRNVLLNQALLLSIFLFLLCVPHVLAPGSKLVDLTPTGVNCQASDYGVQLLRYFQWQRPLLRLDRLWPGLPWSWPELGCYAWGCSCIAWLLWLEHSKDKPPRHGKTVLAWVRRQEIWFVRWGVVLPLFLFGGILTRIVVIHQPSPYWTLKVFLLLLMLVWIETFFGGARSNSVAQKKAKQEASDPKGGPHPPGIVFKLRTVVGLLLLGIPAALTGAGLAAAIAALLHTTWIVDAQHWLLLSRPWALQLTVGTLLFFWVAPLTMVVASGMIGKLFPSWMAEWLARVRGYTLITGVVWIGYCGGALLLPGMVIRVASYHWFAWSSVGVWLMTTATGVISGKSGKTSGDQHSSFGPMELIAVVAPYVYIFGLMVMLSWLVDVAQQRGLVAWHRPMILLFSLGFLLQWRLDINQFSMHNFYRNRLTRCYLGASNATRNPSPVTGFDENDSGDLCIHDFTTQHYPGPIPIFCCAVNITTGEDLAWQERKAASFAFTPYYSGYAVDWTGMDNKVQFNGFVPTRMLYPGGPTVATAMAASGAAFSPNWGYHTNPATAFLLTMFDARLGLWVPNPRRSDVAGREETEAAVPPASPRFAVVPLTGELMGSVDDTSRYVYLTDGGHFDNSGLYELVRRRCYRIVICDAEQDGDYVFDAIGAAIRKCRIDFGVEIDLDLSGLVPNSKTDLSPGHVVKGFIRYPETMGDKPRGTVTYIKSSLAPKGTSRSWFAPVEGAVGLANMTGDVQAYKRQHEDFPHDSTAEQWFTESQFESYRRLGQKIVEGLNRLY